MRRCFKQKCIQICFRNPIVKKEREKVRLPPDRCPTSVVEREDKSALVLSEAADIDGILDVLPRTSIQRIRPNEHPRGDRSGEQAGPAACRAFKDGVNSAEECRIKKKEKKRKKWDVFWQTFVFLLLCETAVASAEWLLSLVSATQWEEILFGPILAVWSLSRVVMIRW